MLKLTKTGIGLLTKQYRSVLRKCLAVNVGLFFITITLTSSYPKRAFSVVELDDGAYATTRGIAIGYNTKVSGENSIAIGHGYDTGVTEVSSSYSVAVGSASTVIGDVSVALGHATKAAGIYSTVLGGFSRALANNSVALGSNSIANDADTISVGHLSTDRFPGNEALYGSDYFRRIVNVADGINAHDAVTLGQLNDALNYYYTFRVDERVEVIDSAKELRSNKKEMSSLDFMPIKSSSDLRINLIKAEDPLTFSAKTRDDSLVLMEVCHA